MKLLIAVGWLLVILAALNIAIAHAQGEATLMVSPVAMEQSTEEITLEPLTSTWTPSPTFTSVPEAISTATATASSTPIPTSTEVTPEVVMPTNTLEVVASETASALTTTPSPTATLEIQTVPTIRVTISPIPSSTASLPSATSIASTPMTPATTPSPTATLETQTVPTIGMTETVTPTPSLATLSPSVTSIANTPTLTPTEAVSPSPSISLTPASQSSPTLETSVSPTFQPTEMATITSTVSPDTVSPSLTATSPVSSLDLNFYIEATLDPVALGEAFEFRIVASEVFSATGLETAGICAYDSNFLSFPDHSNSEAGTWLFRIAADLNEDDAVLASTNVTAIAIGQSTVTCVLQAVDGEETISSFQAVEVQVIAPLQLSVAVSTHALHPINATLSNMDGTAVASGTVIEGGIHFGNLVPGVYILRVTQPEHLPAVTELVLEDTALNVNCELVFGDLDRDEDIDGEDLTILRNAYHSLFDLRVLATNLYLEVSPPCAIEIPVVAVPITNNQSN